MQMAKLNGADDALNHPLQYAPDPVVNYPQVNPSTHRTTAVGGDFPERYHTITHPVSHPLSHEEVGVFRGDPIRLVGRLFLPGDGEYLWEVVEVSFSKTMDPVTSLPKVGWTSVVVRVEGTDSETGKLHKIVMEEFIGMLSNGVLKLVDS